MMRWIKIITSVLGLVMLFAVIAAVLLMTFVSPNRFKPIITDQVMKATGRQLSIAGDLSWSFFPYLGVKVEHISLSNPPSFKQPTFAEIDQATVGVKFLPLLHGQIESSGVSLNGMKLNLIKNANGQTNWQDLQQKSAAPKIPAHPKTADDEITDESSFGLAVSVLNISNTSINWIDEQTKQNSSISDFELHAKDINSNQAFPFSTSFHFAAQNPAVSGTVTLESKVTLNLDQQIYLLKDMVMSAKINNIDVNVQSNIVANLVKHTVQMEDVKGQVANLTVNGKASVTGLESDPVFSGHFQLNPVDIKAWLQAIGQDVPDLQEMKSVSGDIDFAAKTPKAMSAQGRFKIDSVKTTKIQLSDINAELRFKNNVLQLTPMTAKLYQGDLYSQAKVDLNGTAPQLSLSATLSNIQIEPLLQDLGAGKQKIKLGGMGNVDMQITTSGLDSNTIVRNLNGSGNVKLSDGVLTGIDVGYLIDSAAALVKQQASTATDSNKTSFGSLTASVTLHDGVAYNTDLHLDSPRFDITGKGNVDLVNQQIDFTLQTLVKKTSSSDKDNALNLFGTSIPVRVTGSLESPSIRLDTSALLKAAGKVQIENAKEKLKGQIQDQLKGKAGDLLNNFLGH